MGKHTQYKEIELRELEGYQTRCWEVIETFKQNGYELGEGVKFLIGLPIEVALQNAYKVIETIAVADSFNEVRAEVIADIGINEGNYEFSKHPSKTADEYTLFEETIATAVVGGNTKFLRMKLLSKSTKEDYEF